MNNNRSVAVFLHVAILGRYQEVFDEVLEHLLSGNFSYYIDEIFVNVVGIGELNVQTLDNRIKVIRQAENVEVYEHLTLTAMKSYGELNPNSLVLYLNCLGGRYVGQGWSIRQEWRKLLYYLYLERFQACFDALESYDVVGVDWSNEPLPHMTSNNYWATGAHLSLLPNISDCVNQIASMDLSQYGENWNTFTVKSRHAGEFWIGMRPNIKAFSLFPLRNLGLPNGEFNNVPWWGLYNIKWEKVARYCFGQKNYAKGWIVFLFQVLIFRAKFLVKRLKKILIM